MKRPLLPEWLKLGEKTQQECVIVAGGCTALDTWQDFINNHDPLDYYIIGISDAFRLPQALETLELLYSCDAEWWQKANFAARYYGLKVCPDKKLQHPDIYYLEIEKDDGSHYHGYIDQWGKIASGGNSGYQSLHLAIQMGFRNIHLIGYDMKRNTNGYDHWFDDAPASWGDPAKYISWVNAFDDLLPIINERNISIKNYSPISELHQFTFAKWI